MKRNFLFIGYEQSLYDEITDFIIERHCEAYFSNSNELSISIFEKCNINTVVLVLHNLNDAAIVKYIDDYHPNIKVLIVASQEHDEIISIFNKGGYSILKQPIKLEELVSFI